MTRLTFSQRIGKKEVPELLQLNDIDCKLRNAIYNVFYLRFLLHLGTWQYTGGGEKEYSGNLDIRALQLDIWSNHFGERIDECPDEQVDAINMYKKFIDEADYLDVYDLLEYFVQNYEEDFKENLRYQLNEILNTFLSGYRFANNYLLVPISDEISVDVIDQALNSYDEGVKEHLNSALKHLKDLKYKDSIADSIHAVGVVLRKITGEETLGKGLKKLSKCFEIPPQLYDSVEKLYAFTNGKAGLRHEIMDIEQYEKITQAEAVYILVNCSALINYFNQKLSQA